MPRKLKNRNVNDISEVEVADNAVSKYLYTYSKIIIIFISIGGLTGKLQK